MLYRWTALSCAWYALALLSKETAIVLPVIVFAHAWLYGRRASAGVQPLILRRLSEAGIVGLVYLPVAVAYLAVRLSILHGFAHPKVVVSARTLFLSLPSVALFYVRQWLLPDRASEFYELPLRSRFDAAHVLLPLVVLAALALALWLVRKKLGSREVVFSAVWMVALLLPVFDLGVFPQGDIVHDRYFYLPSFGASLLLGLALDKLSHDVPVLGLPRRWLAVTAVLLVLLSYGTADAMSYWVSDYAMLDHAMLFSPQDPILRNHYSVGLGLLGRASYERQDWAAAEIYLERAEKIDPAAPDNYLQLGMVDLHTNRIEQAESNFRSAVGLRPVEPMYRFALGIALARRNNCAEAITQFTEALALKPEFPAAQQQIDACRVVSQNTPHGVDRNTVSSLDKPAQRAE